MRDREDLHGIEAAVWFSAHCMQFAAERWASRRSRGLTNDELREALSDEFGPYGGGLLADGAMAEYRGEKSPSVSYQPNWREHDETGAVRLSGVALLTTSRRLLEIPEPSGAERQLSMPMGGA